MGFALVWICVWAFIFGIFDGPSFGQVIGFIIVGILPPLMAFFRGGQNNK
mgnify:CR=1 FL=1